MSCFDPCGNCDDILKDWIGPRGPAGPKGDGFNKGVFWQTDKGNTSEKKFGSLTLKRKDNIVSYECNGEFITDLMQEDGSYANIDIATDTKRFHTIFGEDFQVLINIRNDGDYQTILALGYVFKCEEGN